MIPQQPQVPKKNPIASNPKPGPKPMNPIKPSSVPKPTTANKPKTLQQHQESTIPKESFKISAGK